MATDKFDWNRDTWKVIDSAFTDPDALISHQHESFNNMIESTIPSLMRHGMPIKVTDGNQAHSFKILSCGMSKPVLYQNGQGYLPMLPSEARNRDLTYGAPLYIDFEYSFSNEQTVIERRICVGKIPIMLGSKYCHLYGRSKSERTALNECPCDRGGYFIVKGSEKVIISQERPVENTISCFEESDPNKPTECRAEVKSTIDQRFFPIKVAVVRLTKYQEPTTRDQTVIKGHKLIVSLPYGRRPVPLFIIYKAFGVSSDKDVFDFILDDETKNNQDFINLLKPSALEANDVLTQADAIRYVANSININIAHSAVQEAQDKKAKDPDSTITDEIREQNELFRMKYASDLLNREFLPHVGNNPTKKLHFLSLMVQKLLKAKLNPKLFSDRDKLTNKRLDLPGNLLFQIFRHYFQKMLKDIKALFVKKPKISPGEATGIAQEIKKIIQKSNVFIFCGI